MSSVHYLDVLIVGGGLMGTTTALFLRRDHRLRVALFERGLVGAQASGVNFGNVRRQGRYLPQLPLAHRSRALWDRLEELVGERCEFAPTGHVKVAFDGKELAELENYARAAREWDLEIDILGGNALRDRFPWLGGDIVGAGLSPFDGNANPRLVGPAFGRAAARAGALVLENTPVGHIGYEAGEFRITLANGESYAAPALLNAAGAWGGRIAERFGEKVPLEARGPQMAVTEPVPYFITPVLGMVSGQVYLRQVTRGNIVFGGGGQGPVEIDPPRGRAVPERSMAQWAHALRMIPALKGIQLIRSWTGVEGYMADMLPAIGPSATTPGLFHAFGFSGHGFQLGPGVGEVMAELIATGSTATPIADFDIGRFSTAQA
jgi:sarcosine oxidase subunit beta